MKKNICFLMLLLANIASFSSCKDETSDPVMEVSTKTISFADDLDSLDFTLATDNKWNITYDDATIPDWLSISKTEGASGMSAIKFKTVSYNRAGAACRAMGRINCEKGEARRIEI